MAFAARRSGLRLCALMVAFAVAALGPPARAELQVSVYGGWSGSFDSDIDLVQPGGTDMTLKGVAWDGDSFSGPIYYGLRGTYWFDRHPNWGLALDFTHAKVKAKLGKTARVSGTRDGAPVTGVETVGTTFDWLEFTDGLNLLILNALYRLPHGAWTPYGGVGVGLSIPHVEVRRANQTMRTFEYQVTGPAAQALAGLELALSERWSAFGEYKISYARIDADLKGGGSLETDIWTNHVLFGLSYRFQAPAPIFYK